MFFSVPETSSRENPRMCKTVTPGRFKVLVATRARLWASPCRKIAYSEILTITQLNNFKIFSINVTENFYNLYPSLKIQTQSNQPPLPRTKTKNPKMLLVHSLYKHPKTQWLLDLLKKNLKDIFHGKKIFSYSFRGFRKIKLGSYFVKRVSSSRTMPPKNLNSWRVGVGTRRASSTSTSPDTAPTKSIWNVCKSTENWNLN